MAAEPTGIVFYKGAPFSKELYLKDSSGYTMNLTGFGPFVCEIKTNDNSALLATGSIAEDAPLGKLTLTFTDNQTDLFPIDTVRFGLIDAFNRPYIDGFVPVKQMTVTPTIT
jgi:hypothetical protein